jgi:hypothetical protein
MTLKQAKRRIAKNRWYFQGGPVKLLYISYPWHSCSKLTIKDRAAPVRYAACVYYKNNYFDVYFTRDSMKRVANYYFKKQIRDRRFLHNLFAVWRKKI